MNPIEAPRHRARLIAVLLLMAAAAGGALLIGRAPAPATMSATPVGYQVMQVTDARPDGGGYAVHLVEAGGSRALDVYVGASEGMAISLRLEGRSFARPLTVDLLDRTIAALGAELRNVQIDQLLHGTFHGSVHLKAGQRLIELDARPSDAMALALGRHAPIFVADTVLDQAATRR